MEYFGNIISVYTRKEAIEDGVLVDVSEMAKEAGFKVPVAVTAAVDALCHPPKSNKIQSWEGRMWDVLWMAYVRVFRNDGNPGPLYFKLKIGRKNEILKIAASNEGENGSPVLTIMLPEED